jgi:hypothetical protein
MIMRRVKQWGNYIYNMLMGTTQNIMTFEKGFFEDAPAPILHYNLKCTGYNDNLLSCIKLYKKKKEEAQNQNIPFKKNNKMEYILHMYEMFDDPEPKKINSTFFVLKSDLLLLDSTFKKFDKKIFIADIAVLHEKVEINKFKGSMSVPGMALLDYEIKGIDTFQTIKTLQQNPKLEPIVKQIPFSAFAYNAFNLIFNIDYTKIEYNVIDIENANPWEFIN